MTIITIMNQRLSKEEEQELEEAGFSKKYNDDEYIKVLESPEETAEALKWFITPNYCYTVKIENLQ